MKKTLLYILPFVSLISCDFVGGERINGNGNLTTENRQASGFKNIYSSGPLDVVLSQSPDFAVQVQADENLLKYITTKVEGNTLKIQIRKGYNLNSKEHLSVHVSAPLFSEITADGSGNITSDNTLTSRDKMSFSLSGSGDINAKIDAPAVESETNGSGDVTFSGRTGDANMSISGAGDIHCFSLTSDKATIEINGSGDADVYASKQLDLTVNGSGDIRYKGSASVSSHINGSGSVSKAD